MTDPVEPSEWLDDALSLLTQALDEPGADLTESVAAFGVAARFAVSSYAGLSVHATVDGRDLGFTVFGDMVAAHDVATSLRLRVGTEMVLVLYATTPGAFVDLSADLAWLLGTPASGRAFELALDEDLTPADFRRFDVALAEKSSIDQAVGVLLGRGHTPDEAHLHLAGLSDASGRSLHAEAEHLLDSLGED